MDDKIVFSLLANMDVQSLSDNFSSVNGAQKFLFDFWNNLCGNFVLKSDIKRLIQETVNAIKCKLEDEKEMLTIGEAAEYLQVSKSTVYKLTSTHQIPFYKPNGKMIYIHRQDLVDWIKKFPCKSMQQIESEAKAVCLGRKSLAGEKTLNIKRTEISDVHARNQQLAKEIRQKYLYK